MADSTHWHQNALDKLHERVGTIAADQAAAQQGAAEHLKKVAGTATNNASNANPVVG